jgi:succinate-semialdehyde dehydrogenase/glutarate-semialdehyde dehydrogenase
MGLELKDTSLFKQQLFIDGHWVDSDKSETYPVFNPANGELVANMASGGAEETRKAIDSAHLAQKSWKQKTAKQRAVILRKWYELIIENQEDLARIMTIEQGKPLAESRLEILYAASFIEWFAEEAKRVYGDVIPTVANDRRLLTVKQPVGVVAAITPWNFPSAMLTRKAGPALAVGCTCVLKPAEETPFSALALVELAHRAGVPEGVLNVVVGKSPADIGSELTQNHKVAKVTFTGSTGVGKLLIKQCADSVKKVSMELGGNAPVVVFDDADIDQAVKGALASKYRNAGQTCICANRILVQDGIYDQFIEKFNEQVQQFQLGNGLDADVTMGPMINARAVENVTALVNDALSKGAKATIGGQASELGSCFFQPTVLTEVTPEMRIFKEEIFGPVAPVFRFSDEAEAISMANDTEFGLAAYLYSQDMGRVWRVSEALEYGMVGCNEVAITSEVIPFGGVKQSGLGREGSKYGVDDYLEIKYICLGGLDHQG